MNADKSDRQYDGAKNRDDASIARGLSAYPRRAISSPPPLAARFTVFASSLHLPLAQPALRHYDLRKVIVPFVFAANFTTSCGYM
ncbi:MAG: hypothetical protein ACLVJ6_06970 [Merdibacter sp.]